MITCSERSAVAWRRSTMGADRRLFSSDSTSSPVHSRSSTAARQRYGTEDLKPSL